MRANLADRFIGYFWPDAAVKRMQSRMVYDYARKNGDNLQRGYEAAQANRFNRNFDKANRSADLELQSDADVIRGRARAMVRDNAYASGVVQASVRNVVGTGIKPQHRSMVNASGQSEANEPFNEKIEQLWDSWQREADVTGRLTFYEMQALIQRELMEAGECLVHFVPSPDPMDKIPFKLELVDIDRLADDYDTHRLGSQGRGGNEIRRGVELDRFGRPVAYWLYPYHPNGVSSSYVTPERHAASTFLHLFKPLRIGQTRGVSAFHSILSWLRNLDSYMGNELKSSMIASCFSVAIKTISAGADGGVAGPSADDGVDTKGNSFEYIEPGLVARLFPEEEVQVIDPSRNQSNSESWIALLLRSIGVGTGLSYERLTRDYSKTNYSSNRAGDLEDRRSFRVDQQFLKDHLCIPVYQHFLNECAMLADDGLLPWFPRSSQFYGDYENVTRHEWIAPGWEWVDPLKEVKATVEAVDNHLLTSAEAIRNLNGGEWRATYRQRASEENEKERLGLKARPTSESSSESIEQGVESDAEGEEAEDDAAEPANT